MDDSRSQIYESLIGSAIRFVSYRPRSQRELQNFLERKLKKRHTYADSTVMKHVIARMHELKYLDDHKFALWWLDQRQSFKPKGMRLVALELLGKGVSRDIVEEVLVKGAGDYTGAKVALKRKLPSFLSYTPDMQKKKAYEFLYRRGFDSATISRVVDESFKKVLK